MEQQKIKIKSQWDIVNKCFENGQLIFALFHSLNLTEHYQNVFKADINWLEICERSLPEQRAIIDSLSPEMRSDLIKKLEI